MNSLLYYCLDIYWRCHDFLESIFFPKMVIKYDYMRDIIVPMNDLTPNYLILDDVEDMYYFDSYEGDFTKRDMGFALFEFKNQNDEVVDITDIMNKFCLKDMVLDFTTETLEYWRKIFELKSIYVKEIKDITIITDNVVSYSDLNNFKLIVNTFEIHKETSCDNTNEPTE